MRFPVYARRTNPSIDPPILRKSKSYIEKQVSDRLADWVDVNDQRKGIICRDMLYFGPRNFVEQIESDSTSSMPAELPGIKVIPAKMEKNPTLPRLQIGRLQIVSPVWDWSLESI